MKTTKVLIIYSVIISSVAVLSFASGYILGGWDVDGRTAAMEDVSKRHVELLSQAIGSQMWSSEPYQSYSFSSALLEITEADDIDDKIIFIQNILAKELHNRERGLKDYCGTRVNYKFKETCLKLIEKTTPMVEKYKVGNPLFTK
ncbi:MAG: hypothetical protein K6L76_03355 [Agarilytica sp.]